MNQRGYVGMNAMNERIMLRDNTNTFIHLIAFRHYHCFPLFFYAIPLRIAFYIIHDEFAPPVQGMLDLREEFLCEFEKPPFLPDIYAKDVHG